MATLGIREEKKGLCPDCGEEKDGVIFCPAEHTADEFITLHPAQSRFLCVRHFRAFLAAEGHTVLLAKTVKWLGIGHRPDRFTAHQLARAGVQIVDADKVTLGCEWCGAVWTPDVRPGKKMPRGYWRCPNGCHGA